MVGSLTCGMLSGYFGRKKVMISANLFSIMGFLFLRFANTVELLYLGRVTGGYCFGLGFANIPQYTGEISQSRVRKFTASLMPTFYNVGFVVTFGLSTFLTWRTVILIVLCLPCINVAMLFICPESPTWLVITLNKERANSVMMSLRGDLEIAQKEIERMEENLARQKEITGTNPNSAFIQNKWTILSKGTFIRPLLVVSTLLSICWHWTGGPMIGFYIIDIIEAFKIPMNPYWCAVIIACFQLFFGILSNFLTTLILRRKLFMVCGIFETAGTLILGTMVYLNRKEYFFEFLKEYPALRWIPLGGILCFYGGYFGGYVSVMFTLLACLLYTSDAADE